MLLLREPRNWKKVHMFKLTVLPFTQAVVDRVEELEENIKGEVKFTDGNRKCDRR